MKQTIAFARSETAAQLRRRFKPCPKRLAMLTFGTLRPSRVVHLAHFHLGGQAHNVAEIQDIGRQSRKNIDSILRKSLVTVKVHEIGIRTQQDRRMKQWEIRQSVADFRQALKRI